MREGAQDLERPDWWYWELAFVSHLEERMEQRGFSETDLRTMLADITALIPSRRPGRWLARTHLRGQPWVVVVEPDYLEQITVVVTAFPRETSE